MDHTSANQIIIDIMAFFMLLGAFDRCIGGKLGLSRHFEEGFAAMMPLTLNMVGIISIAPVLGRVLSPVVGPVYRLLGADPAMFAGTLLANDMGGYSLALEMAETTAGAEFGGLLMGAMLGSIIVFNIPVGLGSVEKQDVPAFSRGILCSLIAVPIGGLAAGLAAGYPIIMVLRNLIPVTIVSLLVALGLWLIPNGMEKGFRVFGRGISILATASLALAIVEQLTGVVIIHGMAPVTDGLEIVGQIVIVLAGALVLVACLIRIFDKPFNWIGTKLGLDGIAVAGMLAATANTMALFPMIKSMSERGKMVSVAFGCAAASVFGDHLGFTAAAEPGMIVPMVVGKLTCAFAAMLIALALSAPGKMKAPAGRPR